MLIETLKCISIPFLILMFFLGLTMMIFSKEGAWELDDGNDG